jgi:hypothetical protein
MSPTLLEINMQLSGAPSTAIPGVSDAPTPPQSNNSAAESSFLEHVRSGHIMHSRENLGRGECLFLRGFCFFWKRLLKVLNYVHVGEIVPNKKSQTSRFGRK